MNRLDEALQKQLTRFNAITTYQDNLVKEGTYYFHQDLPEADDDNAEESPLEDTPPADNTTPPPVAPEMDPNAGGDVPPADPGMEEPAMNDPNAAPGGDMPPADPGMEDPAMDSPEMPDMGTDAGGDTEVDVTDLVNNSNEVKMTVTNMMAKIDQTSMQFTDMINRLGAIEGGLGKMDSIIGQMEQLAKQVELMRPPTETERRKAVAQDSYPFNISLEDYEKGQGAKNQTELEKNPKMSMMKTIMSDYNDSTVKDSFQVKKDDPFN